MHFRLMKAITVCAYVALCIFALPAKPQVAVPDIEEARRMAGKRSEIYRISAGTASKDGWFDAESTHRHFRIRMPSPFNDSRVLGDAHGVVVDISIVSAIAKDNSKWSVELLTYKDVATAKSYFDKKLPDIGRVSSAQNFDFKGHPAKEVWIIWVPPTRSVVSRQILVGNEQYLLMVEYDTSRNLKNEILKFMNSLEFPPPPSEGSAAKP